VQSPGQQHPPVALARGQVGVQFQQAQSEIAGPISIRPKSVLLKRSTAFAGLDSRAQTAGSR
jgi:hypothetical protein